MVGISDRQKKILQLVIRDYIKTGKPVSSKFICDSYDLGFSPATIRNDLSLLERDGFLTHPHTSAGRVPTDEGYRYYVDTLMEIQQLTRDEQVRLQDEFDLRMRELDQVMLKTSKMLAVASHAVGFVVAPHIRHSRVEHIELVKLGEEKLLVIIVTQEGLVKHTILPCSPNISLERVKELSYLFSKNLKGLTISKVKDKIIDILDREKREHEQMLRLARDLADRLFGVIDDNLYFLEEAPDFDRTVDTDSVIANIIEEKRLIADILEHAEKGVNVYIGNETKLHDLRDCSLVTSSYNAGDKVVGVLGIIGPKRMKYSKMVSLVDFMSKAMEKLIKN